MWNWIFQRKKLSGCLEQSMSVKWKWTCQNFSFLLTCIVLWSDLFVRIIFWENFKMIFFSLQNWRTDKMINYTHSIISVHSCRFAVFSLTSELLNTNTIHQLVQWWSNALTVFTVRTKAFLSRKTIKCMLIILLLLLTSKSILYLIYGKILAKHSVSTLLLV